MGDKLGKNRDVILKIISVMMITLAIAVIGYGEMSFRKKIEVEVNKVEDDIKDEGTNKILESENDATVIENVYGKMEIKRDTF